MCIHITILSWVEPVVTPVNCKLFLVKGPMGQVYFAKTQFGIHIVSKYIQWPHSCRSNIVVQIMAFTNHI